MIERNNTESNTEGKTKKMKESKDKESKQKGRVQTPAKQQTVDLGFHVASARGRIHSICQLANDLAAPVNPRKQMELPSPSSMECLSAHRKDTRPTLSFLVCRFLQQTATVTSYCTCCSSKFKNSVSSQLNSVVPSCHTKQATANKMGNQRNTQERDNDNDRNRECKRIKLRRKSAGKKRGEGRGSKGIQVSCSASRRKRRRRFTITKTTTHRRQRTCSAVPAKNLQALFFRPGLVCTFKHKQHIMSGTTRVSRSSKRQRTHNYQPWATRKRRSSS